MLTREILTNVAACNRQTLEEVLGTDFEHRTMTPQEREFVTTMDRRMLATIEEIEQLRRRLAP